MPELDCVDRIVAQVASCITKGRTRKSRGIGIPIGSLSGGEKPSANSCIRYAPNAGFWINCTSLRTSFKLAPVYFLLRLYYVAFIRWIEQPGEIGKHLLAKQRFVLGMPADLHRVCQRMKTSGNEMAWHVHPMQSNVSYLTTPKVEQLAAFYLCV